VRKIIHVNQHKIRANTKKGTDEPVLTVKTYKENNYAHEAIIRTKDGEEVARVIYRPHKPLSCGARVWIEMDTDKTEVELIVRSSDKTKSPPGTGDDKEDDDLEEPNDKSIARFDWTEATDEEEGGWSPTSNKLKTDIFTAGRKEKK